MENDGHYLQVCSLFKLFSYLLTFTHNMGANLNVKCENINFRSTSLAYINDGHNTLSNILHSKAQQLFTVYIAHAILNDIHSS